MSVVTTELAGPHISDNCHEVDTIDLVHNPRLLTGLGSLGLMPQIQQAGERAQIYVVGSENGEDVAAAALYYGYSAQTLRTQLHIRAKAPQDDLELSRHSVDALQSVYADMRHWLARKYVTGIYLLTSGVAIPEPHDVPVDAGSNPFQLDQGVRSLVPELDLDVQKHFYTHAVDGANTYDAMLASRIVVNTLRQSA